MLFFKKIKIYQAILSSIDFSLHILLHKKTFSFKNFKFNY